MSGKTLSNSTLGLRFMQNARRAKMQAQVEAEQAKVKDDAEWEVSKEVKEAWGIGSNTQSEERVTHETSYVPFLFAAGDGEASTSSAASAQASGLRGRRTFNERGQEVIRTEMHESDEEEGKNAADTEDAAARKSNTRPVAISGFRAPVAVGRKEGKKSRTKTAQMLIRESTTIQSLPSLDAPPDSRPLSNATGFVKPAGIDDPGSRAAKPKMAQKRTREQDPSADTSRSKNTKRKKAEVS